jgi:predicted DNA-binding transcriptional regulator YafY
VVEDLQEFIHAVTEVTTLLTQTLELLVTGTTPAEDFQQMVVTVVDLGQDTQMVDPDSLTQVLVAQAEATDQVTTELQAHLYAVDL